MPQGTVTTYDLTTGVIVDMENLIHGLDPYDVPLLGSYSADGRTAIAKGTCFEKKVEWLDETLLTPRSTFNLTITTGTTAFTVPSADANKFGVGDVILADAEYVRVTAVASNGTDLTVTRGFNSSTAVNHTSGVVAVGIGTSLAEGSDPGTARSVDRSARYNMTQIFGPHAIQVSATEDIVKKYGLPGGSGEFNYQAGQRAKEIGVSIEQAILYGTRAEDTGNEWRTMGGLAYYITTNHDSSTTTLTEAKVLDQLQNIFNAGGTADRIVLGAAQKRVFGTFGTPLSGANVNLSRTDTGRGVVVDSYNSDFGQCMVLLDRWVRASDLFIFNRDQVELDTLRPLSFQMLAKTGDSIKGQMVAEKTLKVRREKHAAKFSALT